MLNVTMVDSTTGNDYSILLCSALFESGVNVELVTPVDRNLNSPVDFSVKHWMPTKQLNENKIKKLTDYIRYLIRIFFHLVLKDRKTHVIHFQFLRLEKIETFLILLLRIFRVNVIFTAHNVLPHENTKKDYFFRNIIYQSARGIIVHSQYIKNKLTNAFDLDPDKVAIIPHGNFDHYLPDEFLTKSEAKAKLGIAESAKTLLFFGYIREYKGLDLLLDAFSLISDENQQVKLVIAGKPFSEELERQYLDKVSEITPQDAVIFHGKFIPFEDVATYFTAADLIILPYKNIDHSGIIHLAYSFSLPVIATNVGDFSEAVENAKSGFILEENSVRCLADTILEVIHQDTKLNEMGMYALKLSKEKYSWAVVASQTKEVYQG